MDLCRGLVLRQTIAGAHRSLDPPIGTPVRDADRSQITPARSQVNRVTGRVSVSIVFPLFVIGAEMAQSGAVSIDGGSKRRSGTRVPSRRRFDMSVRTRSE